MIGVKVSVSLPDADVDFLDAYADEHGLSRSAAVQAAVKSLRTNDLAAAYEAAFSSESDSDWDATLADGLE